MRQKRKLTNFGIWVKKSLLEVDMTQRELAEKTGIDECFLSMILYGIRPGTKYVKRIQNIIQEKKKLLEAKTA